MALGIRLKGLVATMDPEALDDNINELDIYLATKQGVFRDYINRAREEGDEVYRYAVGTLDDLLKRIGDAREALPGVPPYWMNCHRKANC